MTHIIYPCDLTLYGECPKDRFGCGHDCKNCQPHIIEEEDKDE